MIKNIIFDFGDIFINLDKTATYRAMADLGVTEISEDMIEVYHQYEKGLIPTNEFIRFFKNTLAISKKDLIRAWNAVLLDFPKHRLAFVKQLAASKQYRLFLLSNTNELHISRVKKSCGTKFYKEFKNCFEQFYLSHEINFRKPDATIYKFVLNENNLIPQETLFIDDVEENTVAAQKLGIQVWNLNPKEEDVANLLTRKNFLF